MCPGEDVKILHINNTANVAVQLRDAQRDLGHEATVARISENGAYLNYAEDWRFYPSRGLVQRAAFATQLYGLVRWADVVHLHSVVWPRLVQLVGLMGAGRTVVAHYHGTDVRSGLWKDAAGVDAIILATPDLRSYCPGGVYIPSPFKPLDVTGPKRGPGEPFRVAHAHTQRPDLERVKGTMTIRKAIGSIPGVELVEVVGRSHEEALGIYASCHLAVDQMRIGWYGTFALECMSMGIPTLGYVEDPQGLGNPVYPVEDTSLGETVEAFMEDDALRSRVAEDQRRYVRRFHEPLAISRRVLEVYEGARA